ncbi:MAG: ABC transporter substrate binding protein [bacterium]
MPPAVVRDARAEPAAAATSAVFAVRSGELVAYDAVLASFRATLGSEVASTSLPDVQEHATAVLDRLAADRPKLFFALGARAAAVLHHELPGTPLVFAMVLQPDRYELTGRNVAGVRQTVDPRTQLRALHRLMPALRRVGVPFDPEHTRALADEAVADGLELGLTPVAAAIASKEAAAGVLSRLVENVDALWVPPDSTLVNPETLALLLHVASEHRIAVMTHSEHVVETGALLALAVDERAVGARAAEIAREVLAGKPAGQIGIVDAPARLVLNVDAAARLGLSIPREMLREAARVYP